MNALEKIKEKIESEVQPLIKQRKRAIYKNLILRWGIFLGCFFICGIGYIVIFDADVNDNWYPIGFLIGAVVGGICLWFTLGIDRVDKKEEAINRKVKDTLAPMVEKALQYYVKTLFLPKETIETAMERFYKAGEYFISCDPYFDIRTGRAFMFNPVLAIDMGSGGYFLEGIKIGSEKNDHHYGEKFLPIEIIASYHQKNVVEGETIAVDPKTLIIPIDVTPYVQEVKPGKQKFIGAWQYC